MSDTIPVPTVELLLKELKEVTDDWITVGVLLGVPVNKLKTIKLDDPHGGVENWKIEMFHFWLRCKPDASWKDVVQTLELTDHGLLAARVKRTYLLGGSGADEEEFETEVLADANVVRQLRDLETSFCLMLNKFSYILADRCGNEFSKARSFLNRVCGSREFNICGTSDDLLDQLCQGHHIDPFNLYRLKSLLSIFESEKKALGKVIEKYEKEKETFLKSTTVSQFQRAVVEKVQPILQKGKVLVTIKILRKMKCAQTLKDIENLALEGFEDSQKFLVRMHAKPGSIIILWVFPEAHSCELEESVKQNAAVFKDAGVEEVTVGGRVVFPSTLEEDIPTASLKEVYTDFYHRLVEAVSDEHTCQSLLTQLSSPALISEEKISQLTSSKVTGSSFLKTLGLEEESHILVPLVSAMSGVEQLQILAGEMDSKLHTRQDKQEQAARIIERQHEAEFRQLKADKETEVKHLEDELVAANELLMMREKVISAMMAQAKETDTKQRIDRLLKETHQHSDSEAAGPEHSSVEHRSFKIHYGDLFNAIQNPIALFDRLHTANLLPQGTAIQINTLPTEQMQELMDAIETSIQRDSENFYKFVEVLEEDSSIQHLCGELRSTCAQLKSPVLVSSPLPATSSTDAQLTAPPPYSAHLEDPVNQSIVPDGTLGLDRHPKPDSSSSYPHSSSIISTDEAYSSKSSSSRYPSTAPVSEEAIVQEVKQAAELEQAQRVTTEKKVDVHEELLRKAVVKELIVEVEKERERRLSEDQGSPEYKDRMKSYDRLIGVQEDLLRTMRKMQADEEMEKERQELATHANKATMQQELVHKINQRQALGAMEEEQARRVKELSALSGDEIERRVAVSDKLLSVQKELLASRKPTKPIPRPISYTEEVLDNLKVYMQEQLLRKAHQREAIAAMDEEQKRRVSESPNSPLLGVSDEQTRVLEEVQRKGNVKVAQKMADSQQQEYIADLQKSRAQEEAIRTVHQHSADKAMDKEQADRVEAMSGKAPPTVDPAIKNELVKRAV